MSKVYTKLHILPVLTYYKCPTFHFTGYDIILCIYLAHNFLDNREKEKPKVQYFYTTQYTTSFGAYVSLM